MELETILDALPLPLTGCDHRGEVLVVNTAVQTLLGGKLDEGKLGELAANLEQESVFESEVNYCPLQVASRRADGLRLSVEATVSWAGQSGPWWLCCCWKLERAGGPNQGRCLGTRWMFQ